MLKYSRWLLRRGRPSFSHRTDWRSSDDCWLTCERTTKERRSCLTLWRAGFFNPCSGCYTKMVLCECRQSSLHISWFVLLMFFLQCCFLPQCVLVCSFAVTLRFKCKGYMLFNIPRNPVFRYPPLSLLVTTSTPSTAFAKYAYCVLFGFNANSRTIQKAFPLFSKCIFNV